MPGRMLIRLALAAVAIIAIAGLGIHAARASDQAPVVGGGDPGAVTLPSPATGQANVAWPRNVHGQTYGSELRAATTDDLPDLILVIATNGKEGYVRRTDLYLPGPKTPEEAANRDTSSARRIPVYEVDGVTVIGVFEIDPGGQVISTGP